MCAILDVEKLVCGIAMFLVFTDFQSRDQRFDCWPLLNVCHYYDLIEQFFWYYLSDEQY